MTPESRPLRVAIVGGGCAGMTAAFELTRPSQRGRYAVTVFQNGWRLGGKGASGRGTAGRIEEHGLHVWMGYYENAFRLMRECYSELGRPKGSGPVTSVEEAFTPANFVATSDRRQDSSWVPWAAHFPPQPGLPGDPSDYRGLSVADYLTRSVQLVRALLETLSTEPEKSGAAAAESTSSEQLATALRKFASLGVLAGLGSAIEALRLLEAALGSRAEESGVLLRTLDLIKRAAQEQLERHVRDHGELRRLWEIVDLFLATIRGSIRFNLAFDPRGFDAIDDYDCREWLRLNGASERSIQSPFVRALYDLAFAYEDGDIDKPRIAAGAALRGSLRAFFAYRGAFFWKMNGGMGDIVFAPLYEALRRRGVDFAFFHRLRDIRTGRDDSGAFVEELDFDVQAEVAAGTEYLPLVNVGNMPCWPSQPLWDQLKDGARLRAEGVDFESHWETHRRRSTTLATGRDFDFVVLAVGVGALPYVCSQMLEEDARFRTMVEHVASVPTKAFQLWLEPTMDHFGWPGEAISLSGFLPPFDTWADMSHLAAFEQWPRPPGAIAYFCSVLADTGVASVADARAARDSVRKAATDFMDGRLAELWPAAQGGFPWHTLMAHPSDDAGASTGPERFATQFWTANVNPSDRYTLALPGTIRHRISPLARNYENLTLAGDWTACGLNLGCVEAAVMSGMLAAHAISKSPPLEAIVGFDHP
jgi:uncharacterized protein with NAD-binding domain and iron-sulfur cluster